MIINDIEIIYLHFLLLIVFFVRHGDVLCGSENKRIFDIFWKLNILPIGNSDNIMCHILIANSFFTAFFSSLKFECTRRVN